MTFLLGCLKNHFEAEIENVAKKMFYCSSRTISMPSRRVLRPCASSSLKRA
jgi:hypothetical protein